MFPIRPPAAAFVRSSTCITNLGKWVSFRRGRAKVQLSNPIPAAGQLGAWRVRQQDVKKIREQLPLELDILDGDSESRWGGEQRQIVLPKGSAAQ